VGLGTYLSRRIDRDGPLTLAQFMSEALGHPQWGYYVTRDPLGAGGDFTTAPEISQMFGEIIAAWLCMAWQAMGAPDAVNLVELGPGRGTLMADILRGARVRAEFHRALRPHLVETSPVLRGCQRDILANGEAAPVWCETFADVPEAPFLLVANEFFDALPIRQYEMTATGWRERLVDFMDGNFCFVLGDTPPEAAPAFPRARPGDIFETCADAQDLMRAIAGRLARSGGAALLIDYGHGRAGLGETLQAVRSHAYADILANPGAADLTAHVDFAALVRVAREAGAQAQGPVAQGAFLAGLGIRERAAALKAHAGGDGRAAIDAALKRLIGGGEMGTLFKVLTVHHPSMAAPPGFD